MNEETLKNIVEKIQISNSATRFLFAIAAQETLVSVRHCNNSGGIQEQFRSCSGAVQENFRSSSGSGAVQEHLL